MSKLDWLGEMKPNSIFPELMDTKVVEIRIVPDLELPLVLENYDEEKDDPEYGKAIKSFLALGADDRPLVTERLYAFYRQTVEALGMLPGIPQIGESNDVWKYVDIKEVFVERDHYREPDGTIDKTVYVRLCGECEWDPEHGLQLVFRGGNELVRVSEQDGCFRLEDS